ncbi:MAG: hypothetical protein QNK37_03440 [Acidobacteriota bacterium]|nr:hypothetical protein [Acidobacteriota bacterium]
MSMIYFFPTALFPLCFGGIQLNPISIWDPGEKVVNLAVRDNLVVVAGQNHVTILNLTNPDTPVEFARLPHAGILHVTLHDQTAYLGNGRQMVVYDLSDPREPARRPTAPPGSYVTVSGGYLITLDYFNLYILENTPEAAEIGRLEIDVLATGPIPNYAFDARVAGNMVYLTGFGRGVQAVDITDPTSPTPIWSHILPGIAHASRLTDAGLVTAVDDHGLGLLDLQDQGALRCRLTMPGLVRDVVVRERYAFLAAGPGGVAIAQINGPASLDPVFRADVAGEAAAVSIDGDRLYVAAGYGGLVGFQIETMPVTSVAPWVVNNLDFKTRIALYNAESSELQVGLEAVDLEGARSTMFTTVPSLAVKTLEAGDIHQGASYSLSISSSGRVYTSFLTFRAEGNVPSQTIAVPVHEMTDTMVLGGASDGEIPALVVSLPLAERDTEVSFSLIGVGGRELETQTRTLPAEQPFAAQFSELFAADIPDGAGVRVHAADGGKIVGAFFVFDDEGRPSTGRTFNLNGGSQ